jgi:Holliday junction resolvase-like predicted endonuclease
MLNENDVVMAVAAFLKSEGYRIIGQCTTTQQGIDIVAEHPSRRGKLRIEAKGGTSAREGSPRHGREYDQAQVMDRVSKGFYTAAKLYCEHQQEGDRTALAFPDTAHFRRYLLPIAPLLKQLDIGVYMVDPDLQVSLI